jgi:Fe-S-cluster containining protein
MERHVDPISPREDQMAEANDPWFSEGLKFKCTGCGKCCTGSPGYVFLSSTDLERLASHFSLSPEEFAANFTYRVDDKISLIDQKDTSDCIFLKNNQCSVYDARPVQCRTFPWWIHFLREPEDWEEAGKRCEGINHPEAPLVPSLTIQEQCLSYLDNLLEQNFSH